MGQLIYDGVEVKFDDRLLTHLHIVITQKLRRGESFALSWRDSESSGGGRSSVWLHPAIPLFFKYSGSKPPALNKEWLDALSLSANSAQGLMVFEETSHPSSGPAKSQVLTHA
jgi:hypothetical protein